MAPEILPNYFKNRKKVIPHFFSNYFKNTKECVSEILSNYFKNKTEWIFGILSSYFKNQYKKDFRVSIKLLQKLDTCAPRNLFKPLQTQYTRRPRDSLKLFQN